MNLSKFKKKKLRQKKKSLKQYASDFPHPFTEEKTINFSTFNPISKRVV